MDDTGDAVRRFVRRARDLAGSGEELAQRMAPFYGELPARGTVNAWASGRNEVPTRAAFAMLRAFPELSLDEFALADEEVKGLTERLSRLEYMNSVMRDRLDEMLSDSGREPLEFPGA
jgi:hypothetical protein